MEQIEVGFMLEGAEPFSDNNINATWKAHVRTHSDTVVAYVKPLPPKEIYIECVCAILGRALNLPMPRPLIIRIAPDLMETLPTSYPLAFGSQDAGYPSFRRAFDLDQEEAIKRLKQFSKVLDVGVFDEWIANWDRNIGNILYDGGSEFLFIDHGLALSDELSPDQPAERNQVLSTVVSGVSEFERFKINREIKTDILPTYQDISFIMLSDKTKASFYLSENEIIRVIEFLQARLTSITRLIALRLQLAQQEMVI